MFDWSFVIHVMNCVFVTTFPRFLPDYCRALAGGGGPSTPSLLQSCDAQKQVPPIVTTHTSSWSRTVVSQVGSFPPRGHLATSRDIFDTTGGGQCHWALGAQARQAAHIPRCQDGRLLCHLAAIAAVPGARSQPPGSWLPLRLRRGAPGPSADFIISLPSRSAVLKCC